VKLHSDQIKKNSCTFVHSHIQLLYVSFVGLEKCECRISNKIWGGVWGSEQILSYCAHPLRMVMVSVLCKCSYVKSEMYFVDDISLLQINK